MTDGTVDTALFMRHLQQAERVRPMAVGSFMFTDKQHVAHAYPARVFDAVDPRLTRMLRRDYGGRLRNNVVPEISLARTLQCYLHWLAQPQAPTFELNKKSVYLAEVELFNPRQAREGEVSLCCTWYRRSQAKRGLPAILAMSFSTWVQIKEDVLQAMYPGSVARLSTALGLGMTAEETVAYVTTGNDIPQSSTTATAVLPDMLTL